MTSHGRLPWVVEQLGLEPTHDVLEIGCGHGVAASIALARLTAGRYVGVDRSAKMIEASERRNADAVAAGKAQFVCATILELATKVGDQRFDRIFAARVAALSGAAELTVLRELLRRGGSLVLAFDSPGIDRTRQFVDEVDANARSVGFTPRPVVEEAIDGSIVAALTLERSAGRGIPAG